MKKEKGKRIGCTIGVTIIFLILAVSPLTYANHDIPCQYDSESKNENSIKVTCQLFSGGESEQIVREMPWERYEQITTLTRDLSTDLNEMLSISDMRKKITILLEELENEGLLPRANKVQKVADQLMNRWMMSPQFLTISNNLHKNKKMNNLTQMNYFNFIFGIGKSTYAVKPITEMVIDYLFAFYVYFNLEFLYKIVNFLAHQPKMAIGVGWWEASKGGNITTIGLRGIQQWGPDADNNIGIAFRGFVGLAMSTQYINDTGMIIGFSYQSFRTIGG